MSQQIVIESINFDGELAVILFTPLGENDVINLGQVILPYEFNPSLLSPPKDIYGSYNVITSGGTCSNILNVVPTTPTVTLSQTVTKTVTPSLTNSPQPLTPTSTPCPTLTPTKTKTPTKTVTPTPSVSDLNCNCLIVVYESECDGPKIQQFTQDGSFGGKNRFIGYDCTGGQSLVEIKFNSVLNRWESYWDGSLIQYLETESGCPNGDNWICDPSTIDCNFFFIYSTTGGVCLTPTPTNTKTPSNTKTPTKTPTNTKSPTPTPSVTKTQTKTNDPTRTPTKTPTITKSQTSTNTQTPSSTDTPNPSRTVTKTPTITKSQTSTNTKTPTPTNTPNPTRTSTKTPTVTRTQTSSIAATPAPTQTQFAIVTGQTVCSQPLNVSLSGSGQFTYTVALGNDIGKIPFYFNAQFVPDWFRVYWNGDLVVDTGFRGDPSQNSRLIALGYPPVAGTGQGVDSFFKSASTPDIATVVVVAPLTGTVWSIRLDCPVPPDTPTPTKTSTPTITPSNTPTKTVTKTSSPTPTNTKTSTKTPTPSSTSSVNFSGSVNCDVPITVSNGYNGIYTYDIDLGSQTGVVTLTFNSGIIPDRFILYYDNLVVIDSQFWGDPSYNSQLNSLGYPSVIDVGNGTYQFTKLLTFPTNAILEVISPIPNVNWTANVSCPVPIPSETPTKTPTKTQTPTKTVTKSSTPTPTITKSPTSTPTQTKTQTPSNTSSKTPTKTPTPTKSNTPSNTTTNTQTPTPNPSRTPTKTQTPSPSNTASNTPSRTVTKTSTQTPSVTKTSSPTPTVTKTQTPTSSVPETPKPTYTPTKSQTPTNTVTRTETKTPSPTKTSSQTPTNTASPTNTPSNTSTNTPTPTSPPPTPSNTPTNTQTPSITPTNSPTNTVTKTPTRTPTGTPTQTRTPDTTPPPTNSQTASPTVTPTGTPTQTQTPTQTRTNTPTQTPTQTQTPTRTQTSTQTQTPTQTRTGTPTNTNTPTQTKTPTQSSAGGTVDCGYECVIVFNTDTDLFIYDFTANTSSNITPSSGWFDSYDVAHYWNSTTNLGKLWIYKKPATGGSYFREYEIISLCPWTFNPTYGGARPYRDIPYPPGITVLGNGLTYARTVASTNYLIGSLPGTPDLVVEFTINSVSLPYSSSYAPLFEISASAGNPDSVFGDITLTSPSAPGGQKVIFVKVDSTPPGTFYLTQYDYTDLNYELDTSPIGQVSPPLPTNNIKYPQGIFQWNGLTYVIEQETGNVFNVGSNIPYTRTLVGNVGEVDVRGASQTQVCLGNNLSGSTPFFRYQTRDDLVPTGNLFVNMTLVPGIKEILVDYGDGTSIQTLPVPSTNTNSSQVHVYTPNNVVYTATTSGFKLNGSFNPNVFTAAGGDITFGFRAISGILGGDEDPYTFSSFPGIRGLSFSSCSFSDLNGIETSAILNTMVFTSHQNPALELNSFNLGGKTSLASIEMRNCDLTGFSHDLTATKLNGGTRAFYFINNTSLIQLDVELPLTFSNVFTVAGPNTTANILTSINSSNGFENLSGLTVIDLYRNRLTGWTYNLPPNIEYFGAGANGKSLNSNGQPQTFGLTEFMIDLTNNTLLEELILDINRISAITETIINCSSLRFLELQQNYLDFIPQIPNTITKFWVQNNSLNSTSITNLPLSLVDFRANNNSAITYFDYDLTVLNNLTLFYMFTCGLTGWTAQFPPSINEINLAENNLTEFDFSLVEGVNIIDLKVNSITGATNLSSNTSIVNLNLRSNSITAMTDVISTTFPSTIRVLNFSYNDFGSFTFTTNIFDGCSNLFSVLFNKTGLNSTSVDNIIIWVSQETTQVGGTLNLANDTSSNPPNSPRTSASDAAVASLTGAPRNWTVTTAP